MIDVVSKSVRSNIMRRVKSKNTSPEILVRKQLHAAGFRYRLHVNKLPGKPDIVLSRYKTVVFVSGCLWHWHGCKHSRMPNSNKDYWESKIERNVERDKKQLELLRQSGWNVEVVWGCEVEIGATRVIQKLRNIIQLWCAEDS